MSERERERERERDLGRASQSESYLIPKTLNWANIHTCQKNTFIHSMNITLKKHTHAHTHTHTHSNTLTNTANSITLFR